MLWWTVGIVEVTVVVALCSKRVDVLPDVVYVVVVATADATEHYCTA